MTPEIPFRRGAVQPIECIKGGWELIKDQYWLFVGICLVGLLIGSAVPFGILLGPMMVGMYMTFFKRRRGEPVEFAMLFKGFDHFAQSLIASLLHIIPILVIVIPAYFLFYISMFVSIAAQGNDPNPAAMFGVMAMFGLFWLGVMVVVILISVGFTFAYPLIADRQLQGLDAVKLSFKAAFGNFWRLLGLMLLTSLLSVAGVLACYVGMIFILPIGYAAMAKAYEQVFGLSNPNEDFSNLPPPPPVFT